MAAADLEVQIIQSNPELRQRHQDARAETDSRAAALSAEDQALPSMTDCSPTKWHRAHTTWFFETFVLAPAGVVAVDGRYGFLWNSYYDAAGPRHLRSQRGLLSRPSLDDVARYRVAVDEQVDALLERELSLTARAVIELGVAHEQQHQELILTDILHAMTGTKDLSSGLRPASMQRARIIGRHHCTHASSAAPSLCSVPMASVKLLQTSLPVTSVGTKPMPLLVGPGLGCRPKRSGR